MMVKIKAFASFREILDRDVSVEAEDGSTVGDVLKILSSRNDRFENAVFDGSGGIRDYVRLMKNKVGIDLPGGLQTEMKDGDELAIYPPAARG